MRSYTYQNGKPYAVTHINGLRIASFTDVNGVRFVYDADGGLVKKIEGSKTTTYAGTYFEKEQALVFVPNTQRSFGSNWKIENFALPGGKTRKYYFFGGQRVAMRVSNGTPVYLHGDHLGSASLTTDSAGGVVSQMRYAPFGAVRWQSGAMPTNYTFTGQRSESGMGLMDFNARYYDPLLARFISADTIVPGAGNPQSFNRYSFVLNNPLKFVDPSGHDPIDKSWQNEFFRKMGRHPSVVDESIYLFSIAYPDQYSFLKFYEYDSNRLEYNIRKDALNEFGNTENRSWSTLPDAINRLAEHYKDSEKELLIRDIGLLWGGLPSRSQQNNATVASATAFSGKLTNRNVWINAGGLPSQFSDGDADGNIHHWGAFLVYGFAEENQASLVNTLRELIPNPGSSFEDIRLGNVAVNIATTFSYGDGYPSKPSSTQYAPKNFAALVVNKMGIMR